MVRLPDGPESRRLECLAAVVAHVQAAVVAVHHVLPVVRVDPDRVVVDVAHPPWMVVNVFAPSTDLAAFWPPTKTISGFDRIDADLAVVHRAVVLVAHERPGLALVVRAPDPARVRIGRRRRVAAAATTTACPPAAARTGAARRRLILRHGRCRLRCRRHARLNLRVDHVRIRARDVQADPSGHAARQSASRELPPGLAAIARLMDAAARSAADETARAAAPLIRRRKQDVRVRRIDDEVCRAGVVVDEERLHPVLPAVASS